MLPPCYRRTLLASIIATSPAAWAQNVTAPVPATPEACVAIETDATRLACYDQALGRSHSDTQAADAAAKQAAELAKQDRDAGAPDEDATLRERARHRLGSVFANDDHYAQALANAGKG